MLRLLCLFGALFLLSIAPAAAQSTTTYTYDPLGQLVDEATPTGPTTYNYDPAGNRTTVTPGISAPTASLTATPGTIFTGNSALLKWTSTGGNTASITGVGSVGLSGQQYVSPTQTQTYRLQVTSANGLVATRSVTIVVIDPIPPTGTFSASPSVIATGMSTTLSLQSWNTTSASIGPDVGPVTLVGCGTNVQCGTATTTPVTVGPVTYTLYLTGPYGTKTYQTTVTVQPQPYALLTADPGGIRPGGSSTLSWIANYAVSAYIDNGVGPIKPPTGSISVSPAATTTYTLYVIGAGGSSTTYPATVTVSDVEKPPIANDDQMQIEGQSDSEFAQCVNAVANDTDENHDTLTIISITQPRGFPMSATFTNTDVCVQGTYHNKPGQATMTYTISDGYGGTSTATVVIIVLPPN